MINIEYWDEEEQLAYQNLQFTNVLDYVINNSTYYKKHLTNYKGSGINKISNLPILTKSELLEHEDEIYCSLKKNYADIVSTSGTTGKRPIVNPLTDADIRRLAYNERKSFEGVGITEQDTVLITAALDGNFVAGYAYYLGVKEINATVIRAGARNYKEQIHVIQKFAVTVIIGVASNLIQLMRYAQKKNIEFNTVSVKKIVIIGEAIRDKEFELNQLGKRLQRVFPQAAMYSTYANTECCLSFCECSGGCGGHIHPDLGYAEIVDEQGNPLPDGEIGRLILTTFGVQGLPLIRYDTGDLTFIIRQKCKCGKKSLRIGPILDRTQQILKIRGVSIGVSLLQDAILSVSEVEDYMIEVCNDESNPLTIYIAITDNKGLRKVTELVKDNVWSKARISSDVFVVTADELSAIQFKNKTRKPTRLIYHESYQEKKSSEINKD